MYEFAWTMYVACSLIFKQNFKVKTNCCQTFSWNSKTTVPFFSNLEDPFREDTHKKKCFFLSGLTSKVLPSLHQPL